MRTVFLLLASFCICEIYGQCLDDDIIMYPPKSLDVFTGFGRDIILKGNYLITSADDNDSLAFISGVVYVFEYENDNWNKIAELTPSIPTKGLHLGYKLAANSNIIAALGTKYSPEGIGYQQIYVFEKEEGEKWTSRNEQYIIDPVPDKAEGDFGRISLKFDVSESFLSLYIILMVFHRRNIMRWRTTYISLIEDL